MRKKSLKQLFPGQRVARVKVWTEGGSVAMDGPVSDLVGDLLIAISVRAHPEGEEAKAMRKCLNRLYKLQESKKASNAA